MKRWDVADSAILLVAFVLRLAWHLPGKCRASCTCRSIRWRSTCSACPKITWLQILLPAWTVHLVYLVALAIWDDRSAARVAAAACDMLSINHLANRQPVLLDRAGKAANSEDLTEGRFDDL
jgi:hypothetical protein